MPNILKNFMRPLTDAYPYVFPNVESDHPEETSPGEFPPEVRSEGSPAEDGEFQTQFSPEDYPSEEYPEDDAQEPAENDAITPALEAASALISYAQVQADAILQQAKDDVEEFKRKALLEVEKDLEEIRRNAQEEGYAQGHEQGMAEAMAEAKVERDKLAREQIQALQRFMEEAVRERDRIFDENREDLKDLAVAIAEKVIRVSLRNSSDIIMRMVDAATDTHKRCEWVHIYLADCDIRGKAQAIPELTASLKHLSNRIRVIPMAGDESGTCIVEMPDVMLDASVSTQLDAISDALKNMS